MGLRVNSQVAAGFAVLERLKRQDPSRNRPESPIHSLSDLKSNSGELINVPETYSIQLSSSLTSALTLGSLEIPERDNIEYDQDQQARKLSTAGLGDRAPLVSNTPLSGAHRFFETTTLNGPNPESIQADVRQEDISLLREAFVEVAYREVLADPNASEETIQTAVDNVFGEGISDLFMLSLEDEGAGKTSIVTGQLEADKIGKSDQELIDEAVAKVRENFKQPGTRMDLKGGDIDKALSELKELVDYKGINLVQDLKRNLSQPSDLKALASAKEEIELLGLDDSTQEKALQIIEKLEGLAKDVKDSFDQNAIFDNSRKTYTSNRYGPAFSPEEIDEIASKS